MVAAQAGVSFMTVSRVLSQPDKVAPATRKKVQAVIAASGYVVNHAARALAVSRSRMMAVLIPSITNSTYAALVYGAEKVLREAGYDIILAQVGYSADEESRAIRAILGREIEGIILYGTGHASSAKQELKRNAIPVVEVWGLPSRPVDLAVGFSLLETGSLAAEHLVARNRRQLVYFGGAQHGDELRWRGFAGVAKRAQRSVQRLRTEPQDREHHSFQRGAVYLDALLALRPRLDAAFCCSDTLAAAIVFEGLKRGMKFPDDLAVCGFGGVPLTEGMWPQLTTVELPAEQMGSSAAHLLLRRCREEKIIQTRQALTARLVQRATT